MSGAESRLVMLLRIVAVVGAYSLIGPWLGMDRTDAFRMGLVVAVGVEAWMMLEPRNGRPPP